MTRPKLIILTCMRSYSSLISAMLGQHSGLYTIPEINPFVRKALHETTTTFKQVRPRSLDGLFRMVAEFEFGRQNYDNIIKARDWVAEHGDWTPAQLMEYVAEKVAPRIPVEKSPSTVVVQGALDYALQFCPDAYFLHLHRHPVSTTASIAKITRYGEGKGVTRASHLDPETSWYDANKAIMDLSEQLPEDRFISVRGEDVLSDPDRYLSMICDWLGLVTSAQDLDDMRHPERSPFSKYGPTNAPFGGDPNFLKDPIFSQRPIPALPLDAVLHWEPDQPDRRLRPDTVALSIQLGYGEGTELQV